MSVSTTDEDNNLGREQCKYNLIGRLLLSNGNECDIAMLMVNDNELREGVLPVEFGSLPALQDAVIVMGYPIGGDTISITSGVVSCMEILTYVNRSLRRKKFISCLPSECHVEGDASSFWHIAKAIHKLKFSFGVIPNVTAKGKGSSWVAEILNRMQEEGPVNSSDMGAPEISTVILLDREILGIYNGSVELEASIMGGQKDGKKIKVPLNSRFCVKKRNQ